MEATGRTWMQLVEPESYLKSLEKDYILNLAQEADGSWKLLNVLGRMEVHFHFLLF